MQRIAALLALLAAGTAQATPTLTSHVPAPVAQHTVALVGAPKADSRMELSFSLPLRDAAGLRTLVSDIYTPGSTQFHHYLTVAEFTARFGADQAVYDDLVSFARANHLVPLALSANRRVLDVEGNVADVEHALHVHIGLYRDPAGSRVFYAPDREPSPDFTHSILHITGLDNFILPRSHLVRATSAPAHKTTAPATGSGPNGNFIGSDVRAAYYGGTDLTGAGQSVGLFEYAGYNLADVQLYFTTVGQKLRVPVTGVSLNGASLDCSGACDDSEQVLDIEEAISMAPRLDQVVVYVGNNDVSILNRMAEDNTSKQLSSSWGWNADAAVLDPIFFEFAVQGQTFVDATGDDGFQLLRDAVWPGDDQYVTGVGGTDLVTAGPGGAWKSETGWQFSGGGPSPDSIPIPSYQVPFITLANHGSKTLRNVPDIAGDANTDNFSCFNGACSTGNGGTSYAAPLWAGFIALANQQAAALRLPPVGFLNPTLYQLGAAPDYTNALHDQVVGFNGRYFARRGFDLVTGFGSPRGEALIRALLGK